MVQDLVKINQDLIEEVSEVTFTDYELIAGYNRIENKLETYIDVNNLMTALEDLMVSYHKLQEDYEDFQQNVKDNYRQLDINEQI